MLFTWEQGFEPVLLHFSLDIVNSFLVLNEDCQMISHDELFSRRGLTLTPLFPHLAHPDREALVRESYSIFSVHYCLEAKPSEQGLIELLRVAQIGDFYSNVTNDCCSDDTHGFL